MYFNAISSMECLVKSVNISKWTTLQISVGMRNPLNEALIWFHALRELHGVSIKGDL